MTGQHYWDFEAAGISVKSEGFNTKQEALAELSLIQQELHTVWHDVSKRETHLKQLKQNPRDSPRRACY